MKKSPLLIRVYISVFIAFALMVLLIWMLFVKLSGNVFVNMRTAELEPRAKSLSAIVTEYLEGRVSEELILSLVDTQEEKSSIINAYMVVTDKAGEIRLASDQTSAQSLTGIKKYATILEVSESIAYVEPAGIIGEIVIIGVPIRNTQGEMLGALFCTCPSTRRLPRAARWRAVCSSPC